MTPDISPAAIAEPAGQLDDDLSASFLCGQGLWLRRMDGVEFLDAVSGTFNLPLGYNHPDVLSACTEQLNSLAHLSSQLSHPYQAAALRMLLREAPSMQRGWLRDLTGSTANECAIKIAQKATGAQDVISLFHSHHGQTALATALSGQAFRRNSFPCNTAHFSLKVPAPYCYRCFYGAQFPDCRLMCVTRVRDFVEYASSGRVACMIVEPVMGNGGNIVPPPGYCERLRELCDELGILLVADEVQTGLGRTGHMFASEALGLRPDIITLAKGLGGIGVPVGAVLMGRELDVLESHDHSYTSGGWLVGLRAAMATITVIAQPGFLERIRLVGARLGNMLQSLVATHSNIGDVRGVGFMWGLEIIADNGEPDVALTHRIVKAAMDQRLIVRSSRYGRGNVIKIRPALIATDDELEEIVRRLSGAIAQATS